MYTSSAKVGQEGLLANILHHHANVTYYLTNTLSMSKRAIMQPYTLFAFTPLVTLLYGTITALAEVYANKKLLPICDTIIDSNKILLRLG